MLADAFMVGFCEGVDWAEKGNPAEVAFFRLEHTELYLGKGLWLYEIEEVEK
jgi:hypothetical protein